MPSLGIFGRKKKKAETEIKQKTLLEELCKDDKELYETLNHTLLLNPDQSMAEGIQFNIDKAQEYEKNKDATKARIAYQAAGEISLYEDKLTQAQKFFKKAAEVDPGYAHRGIFEYYSNKDNAERALAVAQEYYAKKKKVTIKKEK
jgi:hypothetical protein